MQLYIAARCPHPCTAKLYHRCVNLYWQMLQRHHHRRRWHEALGASPQTVLYCCFPVIRLPVVRVFGLAV